MPSLFAAAVALLAVTSTSHAMEIIDLTYELKVGDDSGWPIHPSYNFTIINRGYLPLVGGWLEFNAFSTGEHRGTHLDAPAHFAEGKWRMHQIPAHRLISPAIVVDVSQKVNAMPEYAMTAADLRQWEAKYGRIPDGATVLMKSGWGSRYPDRRRVFNTQTPDDPSTFRYPSVSGEAARFLAEERSINALGVDAPSPDNGTTSDFIVHKTLLSRSILILENVANVERLPPTGSTLIMGALKLYDGSGSPMRLLAMVGQPNASGTAMGGGGRATSLPAASLALVALVAGWRLLW